MTATRIKNALFGVALIVGSLTSISAYAWAIQEDHGSTVLIRCSDGSNATVGKSNGGWTVILPNAKGTSGGQFVIIGQAAAKGCGE